MKNSQKTYVSWDSIPKDMQTKVATGIKMVVIWFLIWGFISLSLAIAIIWVCVHFIAKIW